MNVSLFIIFAVDVIAILSTTDASRRWSWFNKQKRKQWENHNHDETPGCSIGQCIPAWKCPEDAIVTESRGSCTYWSNGPWVCCDVNYIENQRTNADVPTQGSDRRTKPVRSDVWKHKTTTESYGYDDDGHFNTPCEEEPWNRNARERPTPISSIGDAMGVAYNRFTTSRPVYKPTKISINDARRPPEENHNRRTTSDPRIVFPTENYGWARDVTRHPPYHTKATKVPDYKSTTNRWTWTTPSTEYDGWHVHTREPSNVRTTTKRPFGFTSSRQSTPARTERPYGFSSSKKPSVTTSTKRSYVSASTKRPIAFPSTRRPSVTTSTKRSVLSSVTKRPSASASTKRPNTPTKTWIGAGGNSNEERNGHRPASTPSYPSRGHSTSSWNGNNRPSSSRTTARTTTKYRITTPLPNVNEYMCGIRDENTRSNRKRRNYNPSFDIFHSSPRHSHGRQPYQRIVGGEEAEPFSWPWVAALYKVTSSGGNRFLSAGSLINEHFVLTAAHVFTPDDLRSASYVVMLGTHNAQDAVAEYLVSSVLQHPRYEHRYYYHDIALLRLERPVSFSDYVMPICLPSPNAPLLRDRDLEGKEVTVMGWGDDSFGGKSSRVLRVATFPIVSRASCNASYVRVASNRFPRGITEEMLCAGDPNGGKDACQGDSGGPLTSIERGRYTQVGIVSFGYQCGDKEFPGVYTKVAPYLSWIAENTQHTEHVHDYDY